MKSATRSPIVNPKNYDRKTLRGVARGSGLKPIKKKPKKTLSGRNVIKRVNFGREKKDWTVDDWKRIIWSDESNLYP